jgi:hypothetical protein
VVHRARLDRRLFPSRLDRIRQPGEAVAFHPSLRSEGRIQDDQHVADAAVGQVGADTGPELRTPAGLDPDPQHVLDAVHVDADGDVGGLVDHVRPVADLDHQRVQVDSPKYYVQGGAPTG